MLKYFTAKKCQNNHNGNINDHWSQITVNKKEGWKSLKYCENYQNVPEI